MIDNVLVWLCQNIHRVIVTSRKII